MLCLFCKTVYTPKRTSKFCSSGCRIKHWSKLNYNKRAKHWRDYIEKNRKAQNERTKLNYKKNKERYKLYRNKHKLENNARTRAKTAMKKLNIPKICFFCKSINNIEVHHKDKNPLNNTINNLLYLCSLCHGKQHRVKEP